jgi:hypothetical protein
MSDIECAEPHEPSPAHPDSVTTHTTTRNRTLQPLAARGGRRPPLGTPRARSAKREDADRTSPRRGRGTQSNRTRRVL